MHSLSVRRAVSMPDSIVAAARQRLAFASCIGRQPCIRAASFYVRFSKQRLVDNAVDWARSTLNNIANERRDIMSRANIEPLRLNQADSGYKIPSSVQHANPAFSVSETTGIPNSTPRVLFPSNEYLHFGTSSCWADIGNGAAPPHLLYISHRHLHRQISPFNVTSVPDSVFCIRPMPSPKE